MVVKSIVYGNKSSLAESSNILLNGADFQAIFIYFAKRCSSEPHCSDLRLLLTPLDSTQDRQYRLTGF
jgi:hypothetical protein